MALHRSLFKNKFSHQVFEINAIYAIVYVIIYAKSVA